MAQVAREPWHLDKRVPIALILTLVLQSGGLIWWAAQMSSEVAAQGRRVAVLENHRDQMSSLVQDVRTQIAVMNAKLEASQAQLSRIERMVERRADAGEMAR